MGWRSCEATFDIDFVRLIASILDYLRHFGKVIHSCLGVAILDYLGLLFASQVNHDLGLAILDVIAIGEGLGEGGLP